MYPLKDFERVPVPKRLLKLPPVLMVAMMTAGRRFANNKGVSFRVIHYSILVALDEFGSSSQQKLCERLELHKSDMAKLAEGLETQGWIQRQVDKADRRRQVLDLTAKGKQQLESSGKELDAAMRELYGALSAAEYELFKKLLIKALAPHDSRFDSKDKT